MYTIYQSLESIKQEIEEYEDELKKMKSPYSRNQQKVKLLWAFERGIGILKMAKPGELEPKVYNWFLGRTAKKPYDSQKEMLKKIKKANMNGSWLDWLIG
jgi:succinate dehydrogenase flavin-adding protein (antitoxin of CptAB toxin-antitoxin module)